jgi:triphosphoribosyl-dephospho-CoA synthase
MVTGVAKATMLPTLATQLASLAVEALIDEAELTPKPALVDARGSGAHLDLDLALMRRSARALHAGFAAMVTASHHAEVGQALRERLAHFGRDSERAMLVVTNGSKSHRGAIWLLGLLVSATAVQGTRLHRSIATCAAAIARYSDCTVAPAAQSHGARMLQLHGARGARGEAEDGFPHVVDVGLPALRQARARGHVESVARLDALMAIVAVLDDTCLLHRGGAVALQLAQRGAAEVLDAGGSGVLAGRRRLLQLDAELLVLNASPGGAADLLAATLLLDRIERDDMLSLPRCEFKEK